MKKKKIIIYALKTLYLLRKYSENDSRLLSVEFLKSFFLIKKFVFPPIRNVKKNQFKIPKLKFFSWLLMRQNRNLFFFHTNHILLDFYFNYPITNYKLPILFSAFYAILKRFFIGILY